MKLNRKTLDFEVDPQQGFVAFATSITLPGHRVVSVDRRGTKATVTFEELPTEQPSNHDQNRSL